MSYLTIQEKVEIIIKLSKKLNITAYEFGKWTNVSNIGARNILNKTSKNPRAKTLDAMLQYLENTQVYSNKNQTPSTQYTVNEPETQYKPKKTNNRVVPYYNIEISGGLFSNFNEAQQHIEFYIDYKPLNDCTAYLPYFGNSMKPMFTSGNTLAVKQINNFEVILWGEPHLVITSEDANSYKTVKCIHKHQDDDKIILRAINPDYAGDIIILKKEILSLFIVKGKIELNEL